MAHLNRPARGRALDIAVYDDGLPFTNYNTEVALDAPDHWWHLGEAAGSFADSGSLANLPLTVNSFGAGATVSRNQPDLVGHKTVSEQDGCVELTQVDLSNGTWLENASGIGSLTWPLTIEGWFVSKPLNGQADLNFLITHGLLSSPGGYSGFFVGATSGGSFYIGYGSNTGGGYSSTNQRLFQTANGVIPYDGTTLFHFVGEFVDNLNANIWLNGVAQSLSQFGTATTVYTATGPFVIGYRDSTSGATNNYGNFFADEVAIYKNKLLGEERAIAHYQAGLSRTPGYKTIGKLRSKSLSIQCESIDVTDIDSDDWRVLDDRGLGMRSLAFGGGGVLSNPSDVPAILAENAIFNNAGLLDLTITFENEDYYQGFFKVTSFDRSAEYNSPGNFSMSAESSGEILLTRHDAGFVCPTPGADCTLGTWTARGSTTYETPDVLWDGSQFVACANDNVDGGAAIRTSTAGLTWTDTTPSMGASDNKCIGYNAESGVYAVGKDNGDVYTSTDLTNWTQRVPSGANVGGTLVSIQYFAHPHHAWIAIQDDSTVIRSVDDGATWTQVYRRFIGGTSQCNSKVIEDNLDNLVFVVTPAEPGSAFEIIQSSDSGVNWSVLGAFGARDAWDIDYDCQTGVYKVSANSGRVYSASSTSGPWTFVTLGGGTVALEKIYYSDHIGAWIAGGDDTVYDSLDDGANWNTQTPGGTRANISGIADNQISTYITTSDHVVSGAETSIWSSQCTT